MRRATGAAPGAGAAGLLVAGVGLLVTGVVVLDGCSAPPTVTSVADRSATPTASGSVGPTGSSAVTGPQGPSASSFAPAPVLSPSWGHSAPSPADGAIAAPAAGQAPGTTPFVPTLLTLPSGRTAQVVAADTGSDGVLEIPPSPARVGWWTGGASAGDPYGSVVLAGHIDSQRYGIGALAELGVARAGQVVRLSSGSRSLSYRVASVKRVPKARLAQDGDAFDQTGSPRLVVITCGGAFDSVTHTYADNVVITAVPQ